MSESKSKADIRLCTINRADENDTVGIQLDSHIQERFHLIIIKPGHDHRPSNAEMAGVKSDDHLIEINGENIEQFSHDCVVQRIRSIVYPEPLKMLVADKKTYENYKQQQKLIHHDLPEVQILPANTPE